KARDAAKRGALRKRRARTPRARTADKYALYQQAVQDPPEDARFLQRVFTKQVGRPARLLREDFCAAAALSCAWVRAHADNRAIGVDIDPEPLDWGRAHNVASLRPGQAERLQLVQGDVLDDDALEPVDIVCAFNFSYFCFHEREVLGRYFAKSLARLRPGGLLFLDLYGGADAQRTMTETREEEGFDYVWDQDVFDPIHHRVVNYIHFEFSDRSRLERAFRYDWRLWTIPELRDLLREVGFGNVTVFWEGTDAKTGEGNGIYRPAKRAADDPAFVTYLVAGK
ncbi:MAG: class I SAM-dependent methyltransferase, partial [Myxococcales bacterium]|nr:class I SAM-dependent methyltransferase [Myxococcales bacterium]